MKQEILSVKTVITSFKTVFSLYRIDKGKRKCHPNWGLPHCCQEDGPICRNLFSNLNVRVPQTILFLVSFLVIVVPQCPKVYLQQESLNMETLPVQEIVYFYPAPTQQTTTHRSTPQTHHSKVTLHVDCKGFWRWCITQRITRFLDFSHRPVF
jgi:hypothetical protein